MSRVYFPNSLKNHASSNNSLRYLTSRCRKYIRGVGGTAWWEGRENCCVRGGLRMGSGGWLRWAAHYLLTQRTLRWLFFVRDGARRGAAPGSMVRSNHADRILVRWNDTVSPIGNHHGQALSPSTSVKQATPCPRNHKTTVRMKCKEAASVLAFC